MAQYRVLIRNQEWKVVGQVDQWISLDIELRYNEVSKWTLKLDALSKSAQLFYELLANPNNQGIPGVYIERNGEFLLSGSVVGMEESVQADGEFLTLYGDCDMRWVAKHLALPHPKYMASPYMTSKLYGGGGEEYHQDGFPNEGVKQDQYASSHIHAFVSDNIGQNQGKADRKLPFLHCTDRKNGYLIAGDECTIARGENLLQLIQGVADYSEYHKKPLQILCRQVGETVRFETVEPTLKGNALLSMSAGTVTNYNYRRSAPEANHILMGGVGEGVKRVFAHLSDDTAKGMYGTIEAFEEYTAGTQDEKKRNSTKEVRMLTKELKARLREKAEKTAVQVSFQETRAVQYGRDFQLGDMVPLHLKRTSTADIVRAVSFRLQGNQESIDLTVGRDGAIHKGLRLFDNLKKLKHRYDGLTKRTLGQ